MNSNVFTAPPIPVPKRWKHFEELAQTFPDSFLSPGDASSYLRHIFVPKNRRWAFCGNGKAGTSSTKRFLFELDIGTRLSVEFVAHNDINSDVVSHKLNDAGVFRAVHLLPRGLDETRNALRITSVRHPLSRAISGFNYLCRTHDLAHPWMLNDRIRMNAMVGFDWSSDAHTEKGFLKFLDYIDACQQDAANLEVNPHWRPQIDNIRPLVFRPDLVGRVENIEPFFREIAERLGSELRAGWTPPATNKSTDTSSVEALVTNETRLMAKKVFARDFEWLGYDPDDALL